MFYGRLFLKQLNIDSYDKQIERLKMNGGRDNTPLQTNSVDANLVTSTTGMDPKKAYHYPVIDMDIPINIVPASRIGHSHLYINHPVSQEGLFEILDVLAKHGIIEEGYAQASRMKGYSSVRLPWIKKIKEIK